MSTPAVASDVTSRPAYALSVTEPTPPRSSIASVRSTSSSEHHCHNTAAGIPALHSLPVVPQSDLFVDWDEACRNFSSAEYPPSSLDDSSGLEVTTKDLSCNEVAKYNEDASTITAANRVSTSNSDMICTHSSESHGVSPRRRGAVSVGYADSQSRKSSKSHPWTPSQQEIDARPLPMTKPQMPDEVRIMVSKVEAIQAGLNGHPLIPTSYPRSNPTTPQGPGAQIRGPHSTYQRPRTGQRPTNGPYFSPNIQHVQAPTPQKALSTRSKRSMRSLFSLPGTPRTPKVSQYTMVKPFAGVLRLPATDAEVRNLGVMNRVVAVMEGYYTDTTASSPPSPAARDRRLSELSDLITGLRVTEREDDRSSATSCGGCSVLDGFVSTGDRE